MESFKGLGFSEVKYQGKQIMIFEKLDVDGLRTIAGSNPKHTTPAPNGTANLSCIGPLTLVTRIFSNFLRTHQYPAFTTLDHASSGNHKFEDGDESGKSTGKRTASVLGGGVDRVRDSSSASRARETETMAVDSDPSSDDSALKYALPAPANDLGWGSVDSIPHNDGLYCSYHPELAIPDSKAVPNLIRDYFLPCLGTSATGVRDAMSQIESAFGVLCNTDVGHELAHMATCIRLSILAQARCFPIFSGDDYEGSVISGAGYTMIVERETFTPVPYSILIERVHEMGTHHSALNAISRFCGVSVRTLEGTNDDPVDSMYKLREIVIEAKMTESDKDEIKKQLAFLR
jgi:hypothetical protein